MRGYISTKTKTTTTKTKKYRQQIGELTYIKAIRHLERNHTINCQKILVLGL